MAFAWSSTYTLVSLIFIGFLLLSHSQPLTQQLQNRAPGLVGQRATSAAVRRPSYVTIW
ncbi:MAG: hypothetical protein ABIV47_28380 [Roseiflexaceae bacterium]